MNLSNRIRIAFERNTLLSQAGLARACGISRASVNAWVSGKTESIDGKFLTTAATYLNVQAHWLSTGEGEMLPRDLVSTSRVGGGLSIANTSPGPDLRGKVPLISWVQAGAWCQAVDLLPPGQAERWMNCPVSHSAGTFALRGSVKEFLEIVSFAC